MGVADMVLEGLLCEECGCYVDDMEAPGYPRKCEDCKPKPMRSKRNKARRRKY